VRKLLRDPQAREAEEAPTRILNIDHCQTLGFSCREQAELYLLDCTRRRARVSEVEIRHGGGCDGFEGKESRREIACARQVKSKEKFYSAQFATRPF
jgi:hypothetical protein